MPTYPELLWGSYMMMRSEKLIHHLPQSTMSKNGSCAIVSTRQESSFPKHHIFLLSLAE